MLAKGSVVTKDGRYLKTKAKQQNPVIHYATMMQARASMMASAGGCLAAGTTIAVRYSAIRKQGFVGDSTSDQHQILDYQMQGVSVCRLEGDVWVTVGICFRESCVLTISSTES